MSTIDKGAASGPPPEPSVSTHGDPPAGQARFDAFISYRRIAEDMAFVDYLQEALAARGKNVWVDRAKIAAGSRLVATNSLRNSGGQGVYLRNHTGIGGLRRMLA